MDEVVAAFLALRSSAECVSFIDAMFTDQEREQIPIRWKLLKTMMVDQVSQRKLAESAGVAPATAARAHKVFYKHEQLLRVLVRRIATMGNTAGSLRSGND
jgi:uncharacterized protein YerC